MSAYATRAQFEAYVEGWVTDNNAALDRLLERATRDVDNVLGPLPTHRAGAYAGLKVDPAADGWDAVELEALARATCAQALHRFRNPGGIFDGERRVGRISGPDFAEDYADAGSTGRYSPDVALELAPIAHRRRLVQRLRG